MMDVYLVGLCGYDLNHVRFVTLSENKAKELFEIIRQEEIEQCKDIIKHIKSEDGYGIERWGKDLQDLINMGYYDEIDMTCDRPYIEKMIVTE